MRAFPGLGQNGDLVGDRQAIAFERDNFTRVIGEHAQVFKPKIDKYLCADAAFVLQQALPRDVLVELAARVIQDVWKRTGSRRCGIDSETASCVVQIDKHSVILGNNGLQRTLNDFVAVAIGGTEYVAGQAM